MVLTKRRRLFRRSRLIQAAVVLCLLLLLAALGCYFFPQHILTVDSGPVTADAMVVLGGTPDRAVRAAELFKQGEAPVILVSGFGDCQANQKLLEQSGVTNTAIVLEAESRTTRENAEFSIPLLRQMGAKRVIIVTSWYHSRRALACFEHYAPDMQFYSRPSYFGYPQGAKAETMKPETLKREKALGANVGMSASQLSAFRAAAAARQKAEWKQVRGYTDSEYWKLLGYWVCYGVRPF